MLIWELFRILVVFFFNVSVFWSWSMRDLSSLTMDRTCTLCIGRWNLNHWTAREVPGNGLGTICISTFCGNIYYFRSQLYRILPRDLRAHSKSWFEAIVQAPDGRCRDGTEWLSPLRRQVLHENWRDPQTWDWEPAPWQDWEALAGMIERSAGQVPHDLWEKRHFQLFALTQGRTSRGDWWSLRWVRESFSDMLSKHSTQCLPRKFREACTWASSSYVSLTPEREPSVCLHLVNESCLKYDCPFSQFDFQMTVYIRRIKENRCCRDSGNSKFSGAMKDKI